MTPTQELHRTRALVPSEVLSGLDSWVDRWRGAWHRRPSLLERYRSGVDEAVEMERSWRDKTEGQLQECLRGLQRQYRTTRGDARHELMPTLLAAMREASRRTLGLHPFPVQLLGAYAMHEGLLIEMSTGEGKTLTAGLAALLAGWQGNPCHVITVNDYLVERDAEWLGPLYAFCGLKVGTVQSNMDPQARRAGYDADVTYVTAKELLADFLRDRLHWGPLSSGHARLVRSLVSDPSARMDAWVVQRGLHTAIVDEADSILIDEAVTPLIISAPRPNAAMDLATIQAFHLASQLSRDLHYKTELRYREVQFEPAGRAVIGQEAKNLGGLWLRQERREELVREALIAREFFHRDRHYVIQEGRIVIVDESTGRPMPNRTWHQMLHQAIEAKEGLALSPPPETVARMSFQRFFRCYPRLSGMSGTALEAAEELWHVYRLPSARIPTHRPTVRTQWPDRFFATETAKFHAIAEEVERIHRTGRPILLGTRSVAASERLAELLDARGLHCAVLNAQRIRDEAQIVALAGYRGRITIATNMAGRGTDIRLGPEVAELGGLHVIGAERHESRRVDRQLAGRAGRQGDPGSAQFFLSLEDELFRSFSPAWVRRKWSAAWGRLEGGGSSWSRWLLAQAQARAGRHARRQRATVLKMDHWLEEHLSFARG